MTARYLLDTSVVSVPISKKPDAKVLRRLERHAPQCVIAAPVWHELVYGSRLLPRGRRRKALQNYLDDVVRPSFPVLPYDEMAATWHGAERARLQALGRPAPYVDGQIAAIAATQDLVIVTANPKDFERFRGLEMEDWSTPRARGAR